MAPPRGKGCWDQRRFWDFCRKVAFWNRNSWEILELVDSGWLESTKSGSVDPTDISSGSWHETSGILSKQCGASATQNWNVHSMNMGLLTWQKWDESQDLSVNNNGIYMDLQWTETRNLHRHVSIEATIWEMFETQRWGLLTTASLHTS